MFTRYRLRWWLLVLAVLPVAVGVVAWWSTEPAPQRPAAPSSSGGLLPEPRAVPAAGVKGTEPGPGRALPRFEKLDPAGNVLPDTAEHWECVRDNEHGLVWEVKQNNAGVRDLDFTYSWYSAAADSGVRDGGKCFYIYCDTQGLVDAVNKKGLCGRHDWRLPTNIELMTLDTDREYYDPDIDQQYFPNTRSGYYWTSTPAEVGESLVWSINFLNGFPYVTEKRLAYHVRLVRNDR